MSQLLNARDETQTHAESEHSARCPIHSSTLFLLDVSFPFFNGTTEKQSEAKEGKEESGVGGILRTQIVNWPKNLRAGNDLDESLVFCLLIQPLPQSSNYAGPWGHRDIWNMISAYTRRGDRHTQFKAEYVQSAIGAHRRNYLILLRSGGLKLSQKC